MYATPHVTRVVGQWLRHKYNMSKKERKKYRERNMDGKGRNKTTIIIR